MDYHVLRGTTVICRPVVGTPQACGGQCAFRDDFAEADPLSPCRTHQQASEGDFSVFGC